MRTENELLEILETFKSKVLSTFGEEIPLKTFLPSLQEIASERLKAFNANVVGHLKPNDFFRFVELFAAAAETKKNGSAKKAN